MEQIRTLYEQVAERIIDEMLRGEIRPGEVIEADQAFFVKYRVNSHTAMNAIQQLVRMGLLVRDDGQLRMSADQSALEVYRARALNTWIEALFERGERYGLSRERVVRQVMVQGGHYSEAKG